MKKTYTKPQAEKFEFTYTENVTASGCKPHHGDNGHGHGCYFNGDNGHGHGCRK